MSAWPVRPAAMAFATGAVDPAVLPPGLRLGRRVDIALAKTDPATGAPLPLLPCPYATLLFGEDERDMPPVDGPVLAGEQHVVRPGDGDLLVLMLVRRRTGLSREAFRERWLHGHAPFGLRTSASGYRQLHPRDAPGPDGFDGAGLVFFRDLDHVANARAAPEIARDATFDEMQFIDHGRSMLAMFRFDRA
jgi:hypothetical protein